MSSVFGKSYKQTNAYFIPIGDCTQSILQYTPGTGSGGAYTIGSFSQASWTIEENPNYNDATTTMNPGAGGVFRDMGKTVVSSGLTFRKIQLLVNSPSTFGVGGPSGTVPDADFLTGYIQLSSGPYGVASGAAPVAMYPSLW